MFLPMTLASGGLAWLLSSSVKRVKDNALHEYDLTLDEATENVVGNNETLGTIRDTYGSLVDKAATGKAVKGEEDGILSERIDKNLENLRTNSDINREVWWGKKIADFKSTGILAGIAALGGAAASFIPGGALVKTGILGATAIGGGLASMGGYVESDTNRILHRLRKLKFNNANNVELQSLLNNLKTLGIDQHTLRTSSLEDIQKALEGKDISNSGYKALYKYYDEQEERSKVFTEGEDAINKWNPINWRLKPLEFSQAWQGTFASWTKSGLNLLAGTDLAAVA